MCEIAMRQAGLPVPQPCDCKTAPRFNPAKGFVALGNTVIAGASAASGGIKLAAAAGLTATGAGAPPGAVLFGWSAWNLRSSVAAWNRARQGWSEAMNESWCDANIKNFYALLPHGTRYDDPNEPSGPIPYFKDKGFLHFLAEIGYF